MNSINNIEHERHCMYCDHIFTIHATLKQHFSCPKCASGAYPTQYFNQQQKYYMNEHDFDEDNAATHAMRDCIDSYCGCHNAALCLENNMHAPHNAACHTSTLQIACIDLITFLQEKKFSELEDRLTSIENLLALPD
jgi:hypothetical protein